MRIIHPIHARPAPATRNTTSPPPTLPPAPSPADSIPTLAPEIPTVHPSTPKAHPPAPNAQHPGREPSTSRLEPSTPNLEPPCLEPPCLEPPTPRRESPTPDLEPPCLEPTTPVSNPQPPAANSRVHALSAAEAAALSLSPGQRTAIEKMLGGHTLGDAADAAGVTRMTLYRWLNHDPKFQAAYNAWQHDALLNARTKLLSLADTAVNTVGHAIKHDARLAFRFLTALGTLNTPTPGPTDPREIEQRMELERTQKQSDIGEKLFYASLSSGLYGQPTSHQSNRLLDQLKEDST